MESGAAFKPEAESDQRPVKHCCRADAFGKAGVVGRKEKSGNITESESRRIQCEASAHASVKRHFAVVEKVICIFCVPDIVHTKRRVLA